MPGKGLRISRSWRSTIPAVFLGLLASWLTLNAVGIESAVTRKPEVETKTGEWLAKLDALTYDALFFNRDRHIPNVPKSAQSNTASIPEIVIVYIDANSIKNITDPQTPSMQNVLTKITKDQIRYPFPRRIHAEIIRRLKRAGAVTVGLDIDFAGPSPYGPSDDEKFAHAIKDCGNVVLSANVANTVAGSKSFGKGFSGVIQFEATDSDFPQAKLRDAARAASPANLPIDKQDGAIRRFLLVWQHPDLDLPTGNKDFLAFAPMIAALYWNDTQSDHIGHLRSSEFEHQMFTDIEAGKFLGEQLKYHRADFQSNNEVIQFPPSRINTQDDAWRSLTPVQRDAAIRFVKRHEDLSLRICFAGYPGDSSCKLIPFDYVLDPKNAASLNEILRGKIVLLGSMIKEEHGDAQATPLSEDRFGNEQDASKRFGVDIHANIIHTLLSHHYYQDFNEQRRVALVWVCGLIIALLVARFKPVWSLLPLCALVAGIILLTVFSFGRFVFLRPVQIVAATVFAYGLESVYYFSIEDRRARLARSTFQRYVGPKVMEQVLDTDFKPGTVEQRHLTIMFTDVQGFTSLSEKMSPHEVVETFNRYLNEMVEIIDKHNGTLDKIMGDGVMAYFNAPLPVNHHEQKAVECALEMQAAMRSWRELSESLGLPPLKVRIGINSGDVVFGEVGAKRQLGYTVIGDAVNTAARLEPLNKEFGTEILISEAILSKLDDTIETTYVGELAIRGREEGIRAYSVTGHKSTVTLP